MNRDWPGGGNTKVLPVALLRRETVAIGVSQTWHDRVIEELTRMFEEKTLSVDAFIQLTTKITALHLGCVEAMDRRMKSPSLGVPHIESQP